MSKCESRCFRCSLSFFSHVLPLSLRFLMTLDDPIQSSNDFRWFLLLPALPSACLHTPGNLLFPSRALPAHFRCTPHPYSALNSQNLQVRSCALFSLALLVKPDQVSLGGHPFSRLQGTHPLHRVTPRDSTRPLDCCRLKSNHNWTPLALRIHLHSNN